MAPTSVDDDGDSTNSTSKATPTPPVAAATTGSVGCHAEIAGAESGEASSPDPTNAVVANEKPSNDEIDAKIAAYLRSRRIDAHIPVPKPPPLPPPSSRLSASRTSELPGDHIDLGGAPPQLPPLVAPAKKKKQCHGPCGKDKAQNQYSSSQWRKRKTRYCLECSSLERNNQNVDEQNPTTASSRQTRKRPANNNNDDHLLPDPPRRNPNGDTPHGRIRACMCRNPRICRELTWRWVRLGRGDYVNYFHVPTCHKPDTPVGRHVQSLRRAVVRNLFRVTTDDAAAEGGDGGRITRTLTKGRKEIETNHAAKYEVIAFVHYPPEVLPHLLREKEKKDDKLNKWRLSPELGRRIGLTDDDRCVVPGTNGARSYLIVPSYSLEDATRDVERAEEDYKRRMRQSAWENQRISRDMATNPSKCVAELRDLKQQNATLVEEKDRLTEALAMEKEEKKGMERTIKQLQKNLEKMERKFKTLEGAAKSSSGGRTASKRGSNSVDAEAPTRHGDTDTNTSKTKKPTKKRKGSGGRRWSDPRMDRAVRAKVEDPSISNEEALRIGGFEFRSYVPGSGAGGRNEIVDADNVSVAQRKNNLLRRLRVLRKKENEEGGGCGDGGGGGEDRDSHGDGLTGEEQETDEIVKGLEEGEEEEEEEDIEMATVDDLV